MGGDANLYLLSQRSSWKGGRWHGGRREYTEPLCDDRFGPAVVRGLNCRPWLPIRSGFEPLGLPAPAALTEARVALHWAVQVVAAAARALIPAMPDDSHTSLEWSTPHRLLVGGLTPGKMRLGLRPSDLTLVVVDASGDPQRELPLAGRTLEPAFAWAAEALGSPALGMPSYEMPDHMTAHGAHLGILTQARLPSSLAGMPARTSCFATSWLRGPTQRSTRRPSAAGPITLTSPPWSASRAAHPAAPAPSGWAFLPAMAAMPSPTFT